MTVEREIKELIPFAISTKTIRYLGINLTEKVKNLFSINYRTLMKEIEEDTKKWKNISCSWIRRTNIVKMCMLPRAIYTFNGIPSKIPSTFFAELEQIVLKFVWNQKRPRTTKELLKRKNKAGASQCRIRAVVQSCDHKDSMVLPQKLTHGPMEQNREPRNGPLGL